MKITVAYLRKVALWSLSIIAAVAVVFAATWALMNGLLWISGGPGPLYWVLIAVAGFIYLVLVYVGMDLASEIRTKRKEPPHA